MRPAVDFSLCVSKRGRSARSMLPLLCLLASLLAATEAQQQNAFEQLSRSYGFPRTPTGVQNSPVAVPPPLRGDQHVLLPLVDCEYASGADGLTCEKEGYFVSGFEREGQWLTGGGRVPLSRAMCCRIGLPASLPPLDGVQAVPTTVVSVGCHEPSGKLLQRLQCEATGASYVSGFPRSVRVNSGSSYYPLGPLSCCTPALLLSNGDLWSTERCGCNDSPHVSCDPQPGRNRTQLLVGFDQARQSHAQEAVPIAPAKCCQTCLGSKIMDNTCTDLNKCNGHGRCTFASCECDPGWTGPDCSSRERDTSSGTSWEFVVLVVGGLGTVISLCILSWHIYMLYTRPSPEVMEEEMQEALLLRMHEDGGSVGSEDTSDDEEDPEGRGGDEEEEGDDEHDGRLLLHIDEIVGVERDAAQAAEPPEGEDEVVVVEEEQEESFAAPGGEMEREMVEMPSSQQDDDDCCSEDDTGVVDEAYGDCNICFSRPIQVVVVPCGHACMCRRCSRRCMRCPICREDIIRRQRLFLGK